MVEGSFMGIPCSEFFKIDTKKAIIIGCNNYDQLRDIEGNEGFGNIPEVEDDIKVVQAGLRRLRFHRS